MKVALKDEKTAMICSMKTSKLIDSLFRTVSETKRKTRWKHVSIGCLDGNVMDWIGNVFFNNLLRYTGAKRTL